MNLKIFSTKKEFNLKTLNPKRFDVLRSWVLALFTLVLILIVGAVISAKMFLTVYKKDYKLQIEEISVEKVNVNELKNVMNARREFINQEISIPNDPSI